jgi:hypothetical protein
MPNFEQKRAKLILEYEQLTLEPLQLGYSQNTGFDQCWAVLTFQWAP